MDVRMAGRARSRRCSLVLAAIGAVLLLAATGGCGSGVDGHGAPHRRGPLVRKPAGDWAQPNGDLQNTRWVGGPIDAATVSRLHRAWAIGSTTMTGTTLIVHGIAYVQNANSTISAIDLAHKRVLWAWPHDNGFNAPNGVAIGDGRLYAATDRDAIALDVRTGRLLWSRRLVRNAHEGIDMAPGYKDGTVYVSTVPTNPRGSYEGGAQGVLWALDGATGRPRWKWATVPADLWGAPHVNSGGGLWETPAFDDAGGVYVAVGNPGPWPGAPGYVWGSSRPGPNRWTDSIVKLDARSGRMLWAHQVLQHDLYDWDLQGPVILTRSRGRLTALVAGKMGFVFAFDAASGRMLWKRSVGQHNGHDLDGRKAMHGDTHVGGAKVLPGQLGGVETQMAIDQDTVYVPVVNLYSKVVDGFIRGESGPLTEGRGELVALDVATGRVRWDHKLPQGPYSGATVVNDLVFVPTYEGTLWALRTDTGDVAWRTKLPAGSNAPVSIAGDTLIAPATVPVSAGQTASIAAYRLTSR
jgi:outer membrane protein assembly factor BamB